MIAFSTAATAAHSHRRFAVLTAARAANGTSCALTMKNLRKRRRRTCHSGCENRRRLLSQYVASLVTVLVVSLVCVFPIEGVAAENVSSDCQCELFQSHNTCRHVSGCSWNTINNKCRGTCNNQNKVQIDCGRSLENYCFGPPTIPSVCEGRLEMFSQNNAEGEELFPSEEEGEGDNTIVRTSSSVTSPNPKSMCEWTDWFCKYSQENGGKCQLYPYACDEYVSTESGQAQLLSLEEEECLMLGCTWLTNQPHPACNDSSNLTTTKQEAEPPQGMSKMITSAVITGIVCFAFIGLCWSSVVFCRSGSSAREIEEAATHNEPSNKQQHPEDVEEEGLDLSENSPRHHVHLEQDFNIDFDPTQLQQINQNNKPSRADRSTSYGESIAATTLSCDVPIRKHKLPYSIPGLPREET